MSYQKPDRAFLNYRVYRWGRLNQIFRGPQPDLSQPYIACIGAAQTFGRYAPRPFPALLASSLDIQTVNFGTGGAGPGFFLRDTKVMEALHDAKLVVVQAMSARSISNRLYKVNARRNARLKAISTALQDLFPTVDLGNFTFTHNMLNKVAANNPDCFAEVEAELKAAWVGRTRQLLQTIQAPTVFFWFSERSPEDDKKHREENAMLKFPHFVDRDMVSAVQDYATGYVECISDAGMPQPLLVDGSPVLHAPNGEPVMENRYYPSPEMHEAAARALAPVIRGLLGRGATETEPEVAGL